MPRQAILPGPEILLEMREQGLRLKDIAEQYQVSVSAVQKALRRAGLVDEQISYRTVVPWSVKTRYADTAVMHNLRALAKMRQGVAVPELEERRCRDWLERMEECNVVLDYHPDAPGNDASSIGGFFYRTRTPEDGKSFYREPGVNKMLAERERREG